MKASEAKALAFEKNIKASTSQYAEAISTITSAANRGEYEVWIYFNLKEDVRTRLLQDGYRVGDALLDRGGEVSIKISWK